MNNKTIVDIHADDYAYSINTSKEILDCLKDGVLDSISIIGNFSDYDQCLDLLYEAIPSLPFLPKMSVHLNFPEGKGISNLLPVSWFDLFKASYGFNKKDVKDKLKKEIKYQIDKVQLSIDKCQKIAQESHVVYQKQYIRIDSHVHTHSLPIVWQALVEVIAEEKYEVEYIRNPKEPLWPFIKHIKLYSSYSFTNLLKNLILNFYSKKIDRYCDLHKIDRMYMWGLMMSSKMNYDRISIIYQDFLNYSLKKKRNMELLFHPGQADKQEYTCEMNLSYFNDANTSENRKIEKQAVYNIRDNYK